MRRTFLVILFSAFTVVIFAQELKNPTMRAPFSEDKGNFLVLTPFDKIGKSEITIDYIINLRKELDNSKKLISEQQKLIDEQKRSIENLKRSMEDSKKSMNALERKVDDLQRKVK
ncbi:MAG: DUF3450 domain-containing protein [Dysgonamonadaceae bacterium]|jgi:seryl-tRNA synthetase|nr:DUF3450 domain-containing protein [Dysgonamonadaceae bacterium]